MQGADEGVSAVASSKAVVMMVSLSGRDGAPKVMGPNVEMMVS
jgi:hypothetical protein